MLRKIASAAFAFSLMTGGAALYSALTPGAAMAQSAGHTAGEVTEMALGAEDAPITVVEYASFTCGHCANFHHNVFDKLKADYIDTGKVRFIFREAYFDRYGLWASMVARCGGEMRYFGIADMMFEQQGDWIGDGKDPAGIAERLRKIGKVAGLTDDALDTCLKDEAQAQALVGWYQENFQRDNMDATPSFLIDGKKYSNMSYQDFAAILDAKLGE